MLLAEGLRQRHVHARKHRKYRHVSGEGGGLQGGGLQGGGLEGGGLQGGGLEGGGLEGGGLEGGGVFLVRFLCEHTVYWINVGTCPGRRREE